MITSALPPQAPPAVNVLPCTDDAAPSDGKDANSDDGNGFLPTLFTKDKTMATSKSSCESSPPYSQPDSRPMSSLQASLCWIDPLAEEAERRSVQHYDLCYKNERTRGQITFSLRYDYIHRMLMMHLIRAENVQPNDSCRQPNPYVKAYLLPERHHYCRSGIHKKSPNPEFNEVFSFDAPVDSLTSRMLQCTVYDYDRIKRHDIIGNVIMRDLLEKSDLVSWTEFTMQIVDNDKKDDYGDILLYVKLEPHEQKLIVTVGRAYNLRPMDITGASDPYVKITQLHQHRRIKTKKTSIKRANLHPVYNEVLVFDLPTSAMADTNLLIKVMDWDRIGRDDLLGCCIIGPDSVTREGREQWMNCRFFTDNSSAGSQSSNPGLVNGMWHSLLPDVPLDFRRCVK